MNISNLSTKNIAKVIALIGFFVGIFDHASIIFNSGLFHSRNDVSLYFNVFWDSLLLFDSIVVLLLIFYFKLGLKFGIFVIILDVFVNSSVAFIDYYHHKPFVMYGLFSQVPFMLIMLSILYYSNKWNRSTDA